MLGISLVFLTSYKIQSKIFIIGSISWLTFTGILGASGFLSDFSGIPPRIAIFFLPMFLGTGWLAFSEFGKRLCHFPLSLLIGYQAFRIPVEFLIHQACKEGVAPPQMSWNGMNFDIISGVSALLLFPFANRLPKWTILIWNTLGMGLLLWVVGVAILSFPSPFQQLSPDNVWVAHFPFIWLPTIAVTLALLGHLIIYRKVVGEKLNKS